MEKQQETRDFELEIAQKQLANVLYEHQRCQQQVEQYKDQTYY